ncbi:MULTISPECIES: GTPase family protein [unclassified Thioalkalivibrio]|uniref:GTPase family protein n=1 Tax=unclassified Thioalkalivibrio TaxID=2621013 RepID=UPI000372CF4C|nr:MULTISPECIES: GTPase domain-containing protein [unclassified Thioalkalivibrio]
MKRRWLTRLQVTGVTFAAFLLLSPFVVAFVLGLFWLYEHNALLIWIAAAAIAAGSVWGMTLWARHRIKVHTRERTTEPVRPADGDWAPLEHAAWAEVMRLSEQASGEIVTDYDRLREAGEETLRTVAAHYHPEQEDPIWEFTVPEALLLSERVSARLRKILLEEVPLSDRLRMGQILRVWGYRPMVASGLSYGRTAYKAYRIARLANPLHALAAELRDRFFNELSGSAREYLLRRVARIWIEEVGRAAIELYSGRLQHDADALAEIADQEAQASGPAEEAFPGRPKILVVGQPQAGKSTLVNALLGEYRAATDVLPLTAEQEGYLLTLADGQELLLVDTPGLGDRMDVDTLVDAAQTADLVLWVAPAHQADRSPDHEALQAVRRFFAERPDRRQPPIRIVASHIDRLSPAREWEPPYTLDPPEERPKAQNIAAARQAIAADFGLPEQEVIPARLDGATPYNIDALTAELETLIPAMQQTRKTRLLRHPSSRSLRQIWRQTRKGAGRLLGRPR